VKKGDGAMSGGGGGGGAPPSPLAPPFSSAQHPHHSASCGCALRPQPMQQTLGELEFERSACKAALDGDVARLRRLSETRPALLDEASGGAGLVPLHYACRAGRREAARFLLEAGGGGAGEGAGAGGGGGGGWRGGAWRAFCTSVGGATPLHKAAACGHAEVAAMLLDACKGGGGAGGENDAARALAMAPDADGATALHLACAARRRAAATLLLRRCPEAARLRDGRGRTARDRWDEGGGGGGGWGGGGADNSEGGDGGEGGGGADLPWPV